jgi:hypothetical protein
MGFDLWAMLGVSPRAGVALVAGGFVAAALLALRILWRNRTREQAAAGFSLRDDDQRMS